MTRPWESMWQITEKLATGGQGVTKKVIQKDDPDKVGVLKYLKDNKSLNARARMAREVVNLRVLAKLGGLVPNVIDENMIEVADTTTELFMVMDFIDGPTLAKYLDSKGPLSIDDSFKIVISICDTVSIAHGAEILHRDLKPDNIILRKEIMNDVFIIDYGLSFNIETDDITETHETFRNKFLDLPETNTTTANHRDPRSDLTAICAILYYCLTGLKVGQLQDANGDLAHNRPGCTIRDFQQSDSRIDSINELLTRGFSIRLDNRVQTIEELQTMFSRIAKGSSNAINKNNPAEIAKELSDYFRKNNQTVKLNLFKDEATKVLNHLKKEMDKYEGILDLFELGRGRSNEDPMDVPIRFLMVLEDDLSYILSAKFHDEMIIRRYAIVAEEDNCALVATDAIYKPPKNTGRQYDFVEPIAWYHEDSSEILELASNDFQKWISQSIVRLKDLIENE